MSCLRRAVSAGDPVGPDDGDLDHALHAGPLTGIVQVARRGGEELGGLLFVGRRTGRRIDDAFHACQGIRQAVSGDHVHATRPRDRDNVVSVALEKVDDMTTDPPRRSRYCNLHGITPCHIGWVSFVIGMTDRDEGM
jgi:hypothetical protein